MIGQHWLLVFMLLSLVPLQDALVLKWAGPVRKHRCTFTLVYTPEAVDIGKSRISCKPKNQKKIRIFDYEILTEDSSCKFSLNMDISKGKGKLTSANVDCTPTPTTTLTPTPTPTQMPPSNCESIEKKLENIEERMEKIENITLALLSKLEKHIGAEQCEENATTVTGCPSFWTSFGSSCYKLFQNNFSWHDAENHCLGEGGHLTSV